MFKIPKKYDDGFLDTDETVVYQEEHEVGETNNDKLTKKTVTDRKKFTKPKKQLGPSPLSLQVPENNLNKSSNVSEEEATSTFVTNESNKLKGTIVPQYWILLQHGSKF